jgi:adenylate cyclase
VSDVLERIVGDAVAALDDLGVPVDRVSTSIQTLHPEVYVRNLRWTRGGGFVIRELTHEVIRSSLYLDSPVARVHQTGRSFRCDLRVPVEEIPYEVCRELRAEGFTDYAIFPLPLGGRTSFAAFATRHPDGFAEAHLAPLQDAVDGLSHRFESEHAWYVLDSLLTVYLGANAGRRVRDGVVRRGTGETIRAAIWSCDLRGFTTLADTRSPAETVRLLDRYFDAVGEPVERGGGEILKFIGDAVLAVFPADGDGDAGYAAPCARALAAAEQAVDRLAAVSAASVAEGGPALVMGVALHVGEVFYGNIGAARRLDFTVIGPAVNEVSRVEPYCKQLGVPLLVTDAFRACVPDAPLVDLGAHALRGAARPRGLFTLPRFAP